MPGPHTIAEAYVNHKKVYMWFDSKPDRVWTLMQKFDVIAASMQSKGEDWIMLLWKCLAIY